MFNKRNYHKYNHHHNILNAQSHTEVHVWFLITDALRAVAHNLGGEGRPWRVALAWASPPASGASKFQQECF